MPGISIAVRLTKPAEHCRKENLASPLTSGASAWPSTKGKCPGSRNDPVCSDLRCVASREDRNRTVLT